MRRVYTRRQAKRRGKGRHSANQNKKRRIVAGCFFLAFGILSSGSMAWPGIRGVVLILHFIRKLSIKKTHRLVPGGGAFIVLRNVFVTFWAYLCYLIWPRKYRDSSSERGVKVAVCCLCLFIFSTHQSCPRTTF